MPLTADASANIAELTKAHPEWPRDRQIAAGLSAAREHGGDDERRKRQRAQAAAFKGE